MMKQEKKSKIVVLSMEVGQSNSSQVIDSQISPNKDIVKSNRSSITNIQSPEFTDAIETGDYSTHTVNDVSDTIKTNDGIIKNNKFFTIVKGKTSVCNSENAINILPKTIQFQSMISGSVKEEPMEDESDCSSEPLDRDCHQPIEIANPEFLEVYDKTVGDISSMFTKVHNDPLNYMECSICFKKIKESSMKQHFRTHAGLRPFPCDVCGTRFTRKSDVYRHKRVVHKKDKPYMCRICDKTFPHRNLLILHLQSHTSHISYECETCGYKFGKKDYYDSHTRFIHPTNNAPKTTVINRKHEIEAQLKELREEEALLNGSAQYNDGDHMETSISEVDKEQSPHEISDSPDEETECNVLDDDVDDPPMVGNNASANDMAAMIASNASANEVASVSGQEDALVQRILEAAVRQSADTLEMMAGTQLEQERLCSSHITEVMVRTSVAGGIRRRYHLQLSLEQPLDLLTESGMELVVGLVNQLCVPKQQLDGPIEVELLKSTSRQQNE